MTSKEAIGHLQRMYDSKQVEFGIEPKYRWEIKLHMEALQHAIMVLNDEYTFPRF